MRTTWQSKYCSRGRHISSPPPVKPKLPVHKLCQLQGLGVRLKLLDPDHFEKVQKTRNWNLLCFSRLYTQHLSLPEDSKVWCLLPPSQYLQALSEVLQVPEGPEVPQQVHNWHSLAKTRLHFHMRSVFFVRSQLVSDSHAGHSVHSNQPSGRIFPIANHVCHGPTCDHSSHSSHLVGGFNPSEKY